VKTSLIYEPRGKAREYAALACNVYRGCDHGCLYCYAPAATRRDRESFHRVTTRGPAFLKKLEREAAIVAAVGTAERVLLCFTCDPYCRRDATEKVTREAIKILHAAGLSVQVLTKGGRRALRDLDLFGPGDAFATTLTWLNDGDSAMWEPGAELPQERIETIEQFHAAGIPTWVSLEPVLDPAIALLIIEETAKCVDLFKIGRWNYDARANAIDWGQFGRDAVNLCESLGNAYYIKNDLRVEMERNAEVPRG